ncbi:MAG: N-substituted formamide deformylase [candidate division WS2 bacterium]|nr:N-substituted formamide deformylase [Candidatus Psychracetigena formicireducens]
MGDNQTSQLLGKNSKIIDLKGKTVLPGFVDSHVHLVMSAIKNQEVDFSNINSMGELLEKIENETLKDGKQVIFGWGLDPSRFSETIPTLTELDKVANGKTILISRIDGHSALTNSKGLEMLGMKDNNSPVLIREQYNQAVSAFYNSLTRDDIEKALKLFSQEVVKQGVTFVHALEGGFTSPTLSVDTLLKTRNTLPMRVTLYYQTLNIREVLQLGLKRIGGCLLIDGSFGSHTARVKEPYSDLPQQRGVLYFDPKRLEGFIIEAHSLNLQIAMHAIGDEAIDELIKAYSRAIKKSPRRNLRHRIEHFELPKKEHIEQASKLGIVLSMQPVFEHYWGGRGKMYERRLGSRVDNTNPLKTIIKKGITIAGGSDSFVTPINPILGIYSAVNHPNENERVTVKEAVNMFTLNGWFAAGAERKGGSLEVGKVGDLVVLNEDPYKINPQEILSLKPLMTVTRGKVVYSSGDI